MTVFIIACGKPAPPMADPSKMQVPVTTAQAFTKTVPLQIRVIGNVEPFETVSVKSQVGGTLTKVLFNEGQDVTKNQQLFEIDARPYQQALNQAQANLARDSAQSLQAEANLARDSANLKNADSDAGRYAQLHKEGVASQQQDDQFRTAADALREGLKADRAAIESAKAAILSDMAAIERANGDNT